MVRHHLRLVSQGDTGAPQGSVLGILLFPCFTNKQWKQFSNLCWISKIINDKTGLILKRNLSNRLFYVWHHPLFSLELMMSHTSHRVGSSRSQKSLENELCENELQPACPSIRTRRFLVSPLHLGAQHLRPFNERNKVEFMGKEIIMVWKNIAVTFHMFWF